MKTDFNQYICLKNNYCSINEYSITPIRESDMEPIRQWRNEQIDVLRQKDPISKKEQKLYYEREIKPLYEKEQPSQILFSYLLKGNLIGYGGLTNIDWHLKRAELSFLVNTKRTIDKDVYEKDFSIFLQLIKNVAFNNLSFDTIFTETYNIRPLHIKILEKNGFKLEQILKNHVLINGKYVDSLIHICFRS